MKQGTIIILSLHLFTCEAQQLDVTVNESFMTYLQGVYGPDQDMINGVRYYNLQTRATGHKFLGEDLFYRGRIRLEEREYIDVSIKFDIYNQQVILRFLNNQGIPYPIILNNYHLTEFELDNRIFQRLVFPEAGSKFYYLLADGEISCYLHFSKELIRIVTSESVFKFSGLKTKYFIYRKNELFEFSGKRSILQIFPQHKTLLSHYFRKHKLRIRRASEEELKDLIGYCNQIVSNDGE